MSESYYGAFCRGCGEMTAVSGFTDGEMLTDYPAWERKKTRLGRDVRRLLRSETGKSGPCKCTEPPRTYTSADIERIVAIAAEKQRGLCADLISCFPRNVATEDMHEYIVIRSVSPSVADVLAEFEKEKNTQ